VEYVYSANEAFGRIERCIISEYTVVQVEMTDPDAIKAALEEMGYVYEEHVEAQNLHGYGGDKRQQVANIIVRRKHVGAAANDVGFLRKPDGSYELIISSYDRGGSKKQAQDFMHKIKQVYGKHLTLKKAKSLGLKVLSQKKTADNKVKIKLRV